MNALLGWMSGLIVALFFALAPLQAQAQDMYASPVVEVAPAPAVPPEWATFEGLYLEIHGEPEDQALLLHLARYGSESVPRLAEAMGLPVGGTVHVYLAPSQEAFERLQPGSPPAWADATAYPGRGAIFLRHPRLRGGDPEPLEQVLDHELVHILLGRAFAPTPTPAWLQEGMAQVFSGQHGPDTTRALAQGMLGRSLIPLEQLAYGFPDNPHAAKLAYAQSADFIAWMRVEYGDEALQRLVDEMLAGNDVRGAVRKATGDYVEDVDRRWRGRLEGEGSALPLWWSALGSTDMIWLGTGVLGLVALSLGWRRRRREVAEAIEREREHEALMEAIWARELRAAPPDFLGRWVEAGRPDPWGAPSTGDTLH